MEKPPTLEIKGGGYFASTSAVLDTQNNSVKRLNSKFTEGETKFEYRITLRVIQCYALKSPLPSSAE
jgi:hypothetical protein